MRRGTRRLSENRLLLRPAVNTEDLRWQTQNALNVGYCYVSGRFGLAALPSKISLGLATKPFSDSLLGLPFTLI